MVAISVERWHAVCFLFAPRLKTRYTLLIVCALWTLGVANGLTTLFFDMVSEPHAEIRALKPHLNTLVCDPFICKIAQIGATCGPSNSELYSTYWTMEFAVLYILPLSIVGVMYGVIAYVLWVKSVPPGENGASAAAGPMPPAASKSVILTVTGNNQVVSNKSKTRPNSDNSAQQQPPCHKLQLPALLVNSQQAQRRNSCYGELVVLHQRRLVQSTMRTRSE